MTTEVPPLKTTEVHPIKTTGDIHPSTLVGQIGIALIGILMTDPLVTVGLCCQLLRMAPYFRLVARGAIVQNCTGRSTGAGTHLT